MMIMAACRVLNPDKNVEILFWMETAARPRHTAVLKLKVGIFDSCFWGSAA